MIFFYFLGLLIQLACLSFTLYKVKFDLLSFPGALFICVAIGYHCITEVIQFIYPGYNSYREYTDINYIHLATFVISIAILFFTITYFYKLRSLKFKIINYTSLHDQIPCWLIIIPFALVAYSLNVTQLQKYSQYLYWIGGLIGTNMLLILGLSFSLISSRFKILYFPLLIILAFALFLVSQRLTIITGVLIYLGTLNLFGKKFKLYELIGVLLLSLSLVILLSLLRDAVGRDVLTGQSTERLNVVTSLERNLSQVDSKKDAFLRDFVYRFDGNTFAALVLEGIHSEGFPVLTYRTFVANFNLAVPRFLNPNKPDVDELTMLSLIKEEHLIIEHFRLYYMDYLPTLTGILLAAGDWWFLLICFTILGYIFASFDLRIRKNPSIFNIIIYISLINCILFYEQGVEIYLYAFRSLLFIVPLIFILSFMSNIHNNKQKIKYI